MTHRELGVGLMLFGLAASVGTIQSVSRQLRDQPYWVAMNHRSVLRGALGWFVVAVLALTVGLVLVLV